MNDPDGVLLPHGGYEHLRSYKVAEAVYDATVVFCDRFIEKRSRTHDQMVQAARSGVRNISEGSGAAATSRKTELKLTNVARASLSDELAKDYKSFLIQRGLRVWHKDAPEALAMRERLQHDVVPDLPPASENTARLSGLAGLADFVAKATPELAANAMLCAVNQACYLLRRQIESQSRDFVEHGGFTERLYAARVQARTAAAGDGPPCPECGGGMRQRTTSKGPHAGQPFWGCTGYPKCKGTRQMADRSDKPQIYQKTLTRIRALIAGESDEIAVMATVAAELRLAFGHFDWVGFYRVVSPGLLKVGPYQGGHGCLTIPFERGVCGRCARDKTTQVVGDVTRLPYHIACSGTTRSEIVVPVLDAGGEVRAVLDIDSDLPEIFDTVDQEALETLAGEVSRACFTFPEIS